MNQKDKDDLLLGFGWLGFTAALAVMFILLGYLTKELF